MRFCPKAQKKNGLGTLTNQIADELEAKTIGKSSSSVVENKQVTKSKAVSLGCTVKGTYKDNQCTKYSDLSSTSAPSQYTIGIDSNQQSTTLAIKVKLTPSGGSATTITGSQTLKITAGTTVSISITRENYTLLSWELRYGNTSIAKGTATSFAMPSANCTVYTSWQSNSGGTGGTGGGGGGGGGSEPYGNYYDDYYGKDYSDTGAEPVMVVGIKSTSADINDYTFYPNSNDELIDGPSVNSDSRIEDYIDGISNYEDCTYCVSTKKSWFNDISITREFIDSATNMPSIKGMGIYGAKINEYTNGSNTSILSTMYTGDVNEVFFNDHLEDIRYVVCTHPDAPEDKACFKYRVFENPYYHFKYTCMPNGSNELAIDTGLGCYECYPDESMTTLLPIADGNVDIAAGGKLMLYWWDTAPMIIVEYGNLPDAILPQKYLAQIYVELNGTINALSDIQQDTATPYFMHEGGVTESLDGYDYTIWKDPDTRKHGKGAYSNLTLEHGDILAYDVVEHLLELCRHITMGVPFSEIDGVSNLNGIGIKVEGFSELFRPAGAWAYRFVLTLVHKDVESLEPGTIVGIMHCDACEYGSNYNNLSIMECRMLDGPNTEYILFSSCENDVANLENYDGNCYTESGNMGDAGAQQLEEILEGFQSAPNLNYQWSLYCEVIDIGTVKTLASDDSEPSEGSSEQPSQGSDDLGIQDVITGFRIDFNSDMTLSTLHIIWQHDIWSPRYE